MSTLRVRLRAALLAGGVVAAAVAGVSPAYAGGVYFVKEGDTLLKVSRLFGTDIEALRAVNRLKGSSIHPGDRLRIPDPPPGKASTSFADAPAASPAVAASGLSHAPDPIRQAFCREEHVYHVVVKGDNLSNIARRYTTTVDELVTLNRLQSRSRLSVGQKLLVRRSGPRAHTVRRGDTLGKIAARYSVAATELQALNGLESDRLAVGQRLILEPCDRIAAAGSQPPPLDAPSFPGSLTMLITSPEASPGVAAVALEADPASRPAPAAIGVTERVINLAKTMLDIPYRFGGTTLRGIDCSAYVQRVFGMLDIAIPRTAREQFSVGAQIGRDELSVGDLVFFRTYASFPSHVGIYLGDDLFIHASSMVRKVTIDSLEQGYYRTRFLGGRRLVTDATQAIASAP
jgi:cell wall-associated NlpC family hydrolase